MQIYISSLDPYPQFQTLNSHYFITSPWPVSAISQTCSKLTPNLSSKIFSTRSVSQRNVTLSNLLGHKPWSHSLLFFFSPTPQPVQKQIYFSLPPLLVSGPSCYDLIYHNNFLIVLPASSFALPLQPITHTAIRLHHISSHDGLMFLCL